MECNKEEAIRARGIAEQRMEYEDFTGARKIILKAQKLIPDLENLSQLLTVCDVHCSVEQNKVGFDAELDWYGILQVDQTADEASIKKQYRKLALLLHPDKNNFAGAEVAFKLIGDAYRVLSDQTKRSRYDLKKKVCERTAAAKQPPSQPNRDSYARKQPAVKTNLVDRTTPQYKNLDPQQRQQQNQSELPKLSTFCTSCPICRVKFQYDRNLLGIPTVCYNCKVPFVTREMSAQNENVGQGAQKAGPQIGTTGNSSSTRFQENVSVGEPFSETQIGGESKCKEKEDGDADKGAKFEAKKVSEENWKAQGVKKSGDERQKRDRKVVVESSESCENTAEDAVINVDGCKGGNEGTSGSHYPQSSTRHNQKVTYNENLSDYDDSVNPPSSKRPKRDGSSGGAVSQSSESFPQGDAGESKHRASVTVKEELPNGKSNGREQVGVDSVNKTSNFDANPKENLSVDSSAKTKSDVEAFEYPDPEFYDFDKDRNKDKFKVEQIWAIYDDTKEGMPRYYARIRKVFSPFKLRITWLEYVSEDQYEIDSSNMEWPIALGTFRLGDTQHTKDPIFSHLVSWEKGTCDRPYKIYPRKGEVWAIYKDWNIKWSSDDEGPGQNGYEIVKIFSDYVEGNGVSVAHLAKVKKCVFRQHNGRVLFQIPSHEIFRFSHRIPSYEIAGEESKGLPKCSLELDPASLPKEFINWGDGRVDIDGINVQGVGLCSNSTPDNRKPAPRSEEKRTTPEITIKPKEKNIQEKRDASSPVLSSPAVYKTLITQEAKVEHVVSETAQAMAISRGPETGEAMTTPSFEPMEKGFSGMPPGFMAREILVASSSEEAAKAPSDPHIFPLGSTSSVSSGPVSPIAMPVVVSVSDISASTMERVDQPITEVVRPPGIVSPLSVQTETTPAIVVSTSSGTIASQSETGFGKARRRKLELAREMAITLAQDMFEDILSSPFEALPAMADQIEDYFSEIGSLGIDNSRLREHVKLIIKSACELESLQLSLDENSLRREIDDKLQVLSSSQDVISRELCDIKKADSELAEKEAFDRARRENLVKLLSECEIRLKHIEEQRGALHTEAENERERLKRNEIERSSLCQQKEDMVREVNNRRKTVEETKVRLQESIVSLTSLEWI